MMMKNGMYVLFLLIGLFSACNHQYSSKLEQCNEEEPDEICTSVFVVLQAKLRYNNQEPVPLNRYRVISNEETILEAEPDSLQQARGEYPFFTDSLASRVPVEGLPVQFN